MTRPSRFFSSSRSLPSHAYPLRGSLPLATASERATDCTPSACHPPQGAAPSFSPSQTSSIPTSTRTIPMLAMPRDYLTSLPVELFDYICQLVYVSDRTGPWGDGRQFLGAISKAFLPFARQRLFPTVKAYDEKKALRLLNLLATSPGAAAYVTSLTIVLDEYALSARKIKTSLLSAALANLVCVQTLTVDGAGRFAKMVLSPRKAGLLPSLAVLRVAGEFVGWTDPLAPPFYRHLSRYRHLRDLILDIRSQPRGAAY